MKINILPQTYRQGGVTICDTVYLINPLVISFEWCLIQIVLMCDLQVIYTKGQIKSEWIFEIINFPKWQLKNLKDFCPGRFHRLGTCDLFWLFSRLLYSGECITYLVWITFQCRNLSNLFGGILRKLMIS